MPDFERLLRDLHLYTTSEESRPLVEAYYKGKDRARKEVAVIAAAIAVGAFLAKAIC